MQYPTRYIAHYFMGCSYAANKWMFGPRVANSPNCSVLRNGIDFSLFSFDADSRRKKRLELGINENDFVIANVGRLVHQKAQAILIYAMSHVVKKNSSAKLLLIGDGPLRDSYKKLVKELNLCDSVFLLGTRSDIPRLLSAVDIFCMPSVNEGLGIAAIEAQASGCSTLVSSAIPEEAYISDYIVKVSEGSDWAEAILNTKIRKNDERSKPLISSDYNIIEISKNLQEFYCSI